MNKKNKKFDIKGLLILVLIISIVLLLIQLDKVKHYKKDIIDLEKEIVELREKNDSLNLDNNTENDVDNKEKEYDCSFTRTYHVVDLLDGYIAEVPEWSYVIFDQFQNHNVIAHKIPSSLKENMQVGKYYEVTYTLKGKGIIKDMDEIINNKIVGIEVTLDVKETDKRGMEQILEDICPGK